MAQTKDYGQRVWGGDSTTVDEALMAYELDREKGLIPYAVALYSFRYKPRLARRLLTLRPELMQRAEQDLKLTGPAESHTAVREIVNRADVLSTYFEWMSRQSEAPLSDWARLRQLAIDVAKHGLYFIDWHPLAFPEKHIDCLLHLTIIRAHMGVGRAREALDKVRDAAQSIDDPNQRARVYRKLGMLYRMTGKPLTGLYWGLRAYFVPGIPGAVRDKSLAALIGIDA